MTMTTSKEYKIYGQVIKGHFYPTTGYRKATSNDVVFVGGRYWRQVLNHNGQRFRGEDVTGMVEEYWELEDLWHEMLLDQEQTFEDAGIYGQVS